MKSRLNPKKNSRTTLQFLADKSILQRRKSGLRHLIKADGTVEYLGYDYVLPCKYDLPNFHPDARRTYSDVVRYNSERAELTATLGRSGYEGHVLDVSAHFPRNALATDLLAAARTAASMPSDDIAYGDAILVFDNRMHWTLEAGWGARTVQDLEQVNDMLQSPRTFDGDGRSACIFFHAEPSEADLVAIKLMFC
jgi:hypothetical protein